MAAMAGDAGKLDPVAGDQLVELLPLLGVFEGLEGSLFALPPAILLPAGHPLAEPLADIFAVGKQLDVARPLQGREPFDRGLQLHAVVGRFGIAPRLLDDLARLAMLENIGPAAGAGIAAASS